MSDTCEEFVVTDAEAFMSSALLSLSLDAMEEAAVEAIEKEAVVGSAVAASADGLVAVICRGRDGMCT